MYSKCRQNNYFDKVLFIRNRHILWPRQVTSVSQWVTQGGWHNSSRQNNTMNGKETTKLHQQFSASNPLSCLFLAFFVSVSPKGDLVVIFFSVFAPISTFFIRKSVHPNIWTKWFICQHCLSYQKQTHMNNISMRKTLNNFWKNFLRHMYSNRFRITLFSRLGENI